MKLIGNPGEEKIHQSASLDRTSAKVPRTLKKVLLVDDSKFLADTLAIFFNLDGYSARATYGGTEAMQAYDEDVPDIAFIDLVMPEVDGLAVARHVRACPREKPTLLVALTGWEDDPFKLDAEGAGFDYFMPKPVDPASIRKFMAGLVAEVLQSDDQEGADR